VSDTILMDALVELAARLTTRADNAYMDMLDIARQDASLGWQIKVERGAFGRKELDAHCDAAEKLGRHRALNEAARELYELINTSIRHD